MADELARLLREQHGDLRALLAGLARQPAITEQIPGPQLRARRRLFDEVRHTFLAQQAARRRSLWPRLERASADGRRYAREARERTRRIEHLLAKREWLGERDHTLNDLEGRIAADIEQVVAAEDRVLESPGPIDRTATARDLRSAGPWPTRPHPDLPRSPRLASALLRVLAVSDHVLDRCSRATE